MNALPKYVASRSIADASWGPVTMLDGDAVAQVADLKAQPGGELQVHGSGLLGRSLLAAGLIDELRLVIAPTILGQGRRYYYDEGPALGMRITGHEVTPAGLTILVLEAAGPAAFAAYEGVGSVTE
jgi:dihydrofolate reductase